MTEIQCVRCGQTEEQLPKPPLRNPLGERVHASIGKKCWGEWLAHQTALINHYGLDVRDQEARAFLMDNMEKFLFATGDAEQVDTSKQGTIQW